jgi:hypothetical protein
MGTDQEAARKDQARRRRLAELRQRMRDVRLEMAAARAIVLTVERHAAALRQSRP